MKGSDYPECHQQLSDLIDFDDNIYSMTKDLAGVAKQIKFESKEDIDPPIPVFEAVNMTYKSKA